MTKNIILTIFILSTLMLCYLLFNNNNSSKYDEINNKILHKIDSLTLLLDSIDVKISNQKDITKQLDSIVNATIEKLPKTIIRIEEKYKELENYSNDSILKLYGNSLNNFQYLDNKYMINFINKIKKQ